MTIRENFKGVDAQDNSFSTVPEGVYLVMVEKAYDTDKKGKQIISSGGNPMIRIRMRIVENGVHFGRSIFDQIVFCEGMKGRNKHLLKVLEQPCGTEVDIEASDWETHECRVRVIHDEWPKGSGKYKAKVDQYLYKDAEAEARAHEKKPKDPNLKPNTTKPGSDDSTKKETTETEEEIPF